MLPKKTESFWGLFGGILFHALSHVSLTHSSLSSAECRILKATVLQYLPYLFRLSSIADSERLK